MQTSYTRFSPSTKVGHIPILVFSYGIWGNQPKTSYMTHISFFIDIHLYYSYFLINITICNYNTSNDILTHHSSPNFRDMLLSTTSHTSSALIFSPIQHVYTTWHTMHRSYFLHHRQLQILLLHHHSYLIIILIIKYYNIHYINYILVQLRSYLGWMSVRDPFV